MLKNIKMITLLLWVVTAEAAEPLSTPQAVKTAAEKQLTKCNAEISKHKPVGNQLISDGLTSCYSGAKLLLAENIERATKRIEQHKDADCRKLYDELDQEWTTYAEKVANLQSFGDAPLNTNDDIELVLLTHRYDIAYTIASNSACNL